ncbi:DUF2797 domain-containing protein [Streptomyces sp. NPDC058045]|uniref:DUF2797 domain-containing protein n=1 Tax=Streptomyces sp. NPDC058045 TaxID=3346311 RepID=UPI0036ECD275
MAWWCTGVRWREGRPELGWYGDGEGSGAGERGSALVFGAAVAFRVEGGRCCLGLWRGGRRVPCPTGEPVPPGATRDQCAACAAADRAHSVAADTYADDPRPYRVYLAWFGPGLVKVGITRVGRGSARLLEQGAVAFTWLGSGPLMAARRTEELLRAALGVPDRIPYAAKRAVRAGLPPEGERAAELLALHRRAAGLDGWPESLRPEEPVVVDHAGTFGLAGLPPADAQLVSLADGAALAGTLLAAAGPDLHLRVPDGGAGSSARGGAGASARAVGGGRVLVVDTRLLSGWRLARAPDTAPPTVPVRELPAVQDGLF